MANKLNFQYNSVPLFALEGWDFFFFARLIALLLIASPVFAQVEPQIVGPLPTILAEASGLQCLNDGTCYSFNDSDDDSRLYRINQSGQFLSQLTIQGVPHTDYEDIATSVDGRLFIGDFGNNDNDRDDLRIYILSDYSTSVSIPAVLNYTYEDQSDFPPDDEELNFDVEAMIHWQDSLYLFTRNRTNPFNGLTKIYALPDEPGTHIAQLSGQVFGNLSATHSSITAADISPTGSRIVWLSKGSLFIFPTSIDNLTQISPTYNFFASTRNYEGVSFIDDCNLLLVEEGELANIYSINSCDIVSGLASQAEQRPIKWSYTDDLFSLEADYLIESLCIVDYLGRHVASAFQSEHTISTKDLVPGIYIVLVDVHGDTQAIRIYKE